MATVCVMKTFRFSPKLVEDMERVIYLTGGKYSSMTNLLVVAVSEVIKKERRALEEQGVVWEHLGPDFKKSLTKGEEV